MLFAGGRNRDFALFQIYPILDHHGDSHTDQKVPKESLGSMPRLNGAGA